MKYRPHGDVRRRGFATPVALVALTIAGMLCVMWFQDAAVERRQLRQAERVAQAQWLATSALSRAAVRLAAKADYPGETWTLTADELPGGRPAAVEILVRRNESDPAMPTGIHVNVLYGGDRLDRVQVEREILLPLTPGVQP